MPRMPIPLEGEPTQEELNRFWSKVDIGDQYQCWPWTAADGGNGYAKFRWRKKLHQAHRVAWYFHYGVNPPDETLDHTCDYGLCVNPNHLVPMSHGGNTSKGQANRFRTHCVQGHELTESNTYTHQHNRTRMCVTCDEIRKSQKTDRRKDTIDTCKRGHDTSFPEARNKQGHCKECIKLRNAERRDYKRQWKQEKKKKQ